ncbi:MAG: phosphoserine phosphatase SerB [Pseudomonadota bacterium]|nr:phosphoserine phosphatase SerB [Pseudomonadota bacterium]
MGQIRVVTDNASVMRSFLEQGSWQEWQTPALLVATLPSDQLRRLPFDFWLHCHAHHISCGFIDTTQRIKAVFFDMDRTVVQEESIVELAKILDKEHEIAKLTEQSMAGILSYREIYERRIAMLSEATAHQLKTLSHRLRFNKGIRETLVALKKNNIKAFLISSGFYPIVKEVSNALQFDDCQGSRVKFVDGQLTVDGKNGIVDGEGKRVWVEHKCQELGITPNEVAIVGDGANDVPMMQTAAVAVGFEPRKVLLQYVNALNVCADHRFLLPLLNG